MVGYFNSISPAPCLTCEGAGRVLERKEIPPFQWYRPCLECEDIIITEDFGPIKISIKVRAVVSHGSDNT